MYPSPSQSPAPSPPAFLYLNSHPGPGGHHHQHQSVSNPAVGVPGSAANGAPGAGGYGQPNGAPNSAPGPAGLPLARFPGPPASVNPLAGGWPPRSHHPGPGPGAHHHPHHHQQNPSLSSLPGSLAHSGAAAPGPPPASPGYPGPLTNGPGGHFQPHHQQQHMAHALSHPINSPAALHTAQNALSAPTPPPPLTSHAPHWQDQLRKAEISRQSASPHHHARAAALAARSLTSAAVPILDPNKTNVPATAANGLHVLKSDSAAAGASTSATEEGGKKEANREMNGGGRLTESKDKAVAPATQGWTTIDMGGLALKNVGPEVFRYTFLTSLFINHNNLTTISPDIVRLKNLTVLDASCNKLVSLPGEIGMLTRLKELYLFDNNLVHLPSEFGSLHQLEMLGVEGNPLTENIRSLAEKDGTAGVIAYLRDSCPVPLPPPEREWLPVDADLPAPSSTPLCDKDGNVIPEAPPETFNLLSYNILCEKYATSHMYGYTPSWALAWEYRKEFILQEVLGYSADVCCLQEVDVAQYEDYFLQHLSQQDYEGIYWPKSRARTMAADEKRQVDGCATFFKTSKFKLIEKQLIEFNQIALQRPDFKKTEDMFNRVMTKDNIAVVALLENRDSGSRLIVANAHIHWDPEFKDVKLVQTAMLMDELDKIASRFARLPPSLDVREGYPPAPKYKDGTKIPTIICGDFNSLPESGVYTYLSQGAVGADHDDFGGHVYGNYTERGLSHKLHLKSAYSNVGELPFTNYTPDFEGVIDYVWYTTNSLAVTGLLGEVDPGYLTKVVGFPNAHFPSDHICILSEFRVKPPRGNDPAPTSKPQFSGGGGGGG